MTDQESKETPRRSWGGFIFLVTPLALVLVVLIGLLVFKGVFLPGIIRNAIAAQGAPPQTVSTVVAGLDDWQPQFQTVGTLRALNGADLSAEVAGIVESFEFKSGDMVPAGALLVKLRAEDDIAHLRSLETQADLAKIVATRDRKQLEAKAISQATVDSDDASLRSALALADEQRAVVNKKLVKAPFAGKIGIRAVDIGQYLTAGTTIVTLQQTDPIYLDFSVPQQSLALMKAGSKVGLAVDAYPGEVFHGEIVATDAKVDTDTRNAKVRATLKNPDGRLLPGMYGTVTVDTGTPQRILTLPQTAIAFATFGSTVYLIDDKGPDAAGKPQLIARQNFVTTGATRGDQIAVLSGVKAGDVVVSSGQSKLHNGSGVTINNAVQPLNDPHPTPVEK
jgi:membrane fusion protein (multidrug efflux system)